jgi:competence protein ComEA
MKLIRPYLIEIILIISATIITGVSVFLQLQNKNTPVPEIARTDDNQKITKTSLSQKNDKIHIDVSGAVLNPDLYEATPGSRLKDIIDLAGGLSGEADKLYIARNFNMSKFVSDEEKIYLPYTWDITNGTFTESPRVLEYLSSDIETKKQSTVPEINSTEGLISLNESSIDELDSLPGIGPVSAQKIIDGRPFTATDELITKKIINSSVFEKIKDLIYL